MTSTWAAGAKEKALKSVFCIRYPVQFKKNKTPLQALSDSESEVNAMHSSFAKQLGLLIQLIDVRTQKIDSTMLDTHEMVVAVFSKVNRANRVRFFEEIFLVANVSPEVVLGIPFFALSSADIDFSGRELCWRTYTTEEMLSTTRRVKLVGKKKFAAAALELEYKTYVVHVASLNSNPLVAPLDVHLFRRPQISGLIAKEASTKVLVEYSEFVDIFSPELVFDLSDHSGINNHAIKLVNSYQQLFYGPIYSLGPVESETLKAYIETNLANGFIKPSKSPARTPILFDQKSDGSFRLCIDFQSLNNFMLKNQYPLPLIGELLDRLGRARRFT